MVWQPASRSPHPNDDIDAHRTTLHGFPHLERTAARVLVVNPLDEVLLLHYPPDPSAGRTIERWLLPGGGRDPGESYEDAAHRELYEETCLRVDAFAGEVFRRDFTIRWGHGTLHQHERVFLARIRDTTPTIEADGRHPQWWRAEEMQREGIATRPFELARIVTEVLHTGIPPEPLVLAPLIAPPVRELWASTQENVREDRSGP